MLSCRPVSSPGGCKRLSSKDWSSTDSSGYVSEDGSRLRRGMMAKANSYGGKPTIHLSPNTRTCSLSKAGTYWCSGLFLLKLTPWVLWSLCSDWWLQGWGYICSAGCCGEWLVIVQSGGWNNSVGSMLGLLCFCCMMECCGFNPLSFW